MIKKEELEKLGRVDMSLNDRTEGASPRGYHFIDAWRGCKRAWAFKYVLGLEEDVPKAPLVIGKAIHAWQEEYLRRIFILGQNIKDICESKDMEEIISSIPREAFFEESEYTQALEGVRAVCIAWAEGTYDDFHTYRPLLVEEELYYPLKVQTSSCEVIIEVTGRVDRLYEHVPTGTLLLLDTKSTKGKTVDYVEKTSSSQDQFVSYSGLIWNKFHKMPQVAIDVCSYKPVRYTRSEEFFHSSSDIQDYFEGLSGSWSDVLQTLELWAESLLNEEGISSLESTFHELFPRSPGRCAYFGCEFMDMCRGCRDLFSPRPGFKQYRPVQVADLFTKSQEYEGKVQGGLEAPPKEE